jgi:phosphatidate cytidylyltransferase
MLYKRVITGLLFLPIFYLVAWKLPPVYFVALVLAAVAVGQFEFYRMAKARGSHPDSVLGIVLGALIVWEFYCPLLPELGYFFPVVLSAVLIMVARLFSPRPVEGAIEDAASTLLGGCYVAMLFAYQVGILLSGEEGKHWLVFLYLIIWASDIGAYSIGIPFGKHRLYEKISPKKSIEGLLGALIAAVAMALLCRAWFMPPLGAGEAITIAIMLALVGTLGDLVESMFKRAAGVKDSGSIIPGHGGILDRMDSMLFAAPVLYYYLRLWG